MGILDSLVRTTEAINSAVQWPTNAILKLASKTTAKISKTIVKPVKSNDFINEIEEIGSTIKNKSVNKPEPIISKFMDYQRKPVSTGRIGYIGSMGNVGQSGNYGTASASTNRDSGWILQEDLELSNLAGSKYIIFDSPSIIKHNSLIHIANSRINGNPIYSYTGDGVNILNDTGYEWNELA
jgi:hypothetical protein